MNERPFVRSLGALTGNQAVQQVKAGLEAIYLSGWQVAADANLAGHMYPDQSLYPANSVPHVGQEDQPGAAEGRSDPPRRGQERHQLVRPHSRRRRGRVRRRPQRLRVDEGHDRSRRRRRPLRGPARLGEEVRAHGRQGPHPDLAGRQEPRLRPARRRRHGRPDRHHRQDRRRRGQPHHQRRGPDRPRVPHGRADDGGLLQGERGNGSGHLPRALLCAVCGRGVVRDFGAQPRAGPRLRRGHPREVPWQAARVQLLAFLQLEEEALGGGDLARSRRRSGRWATASSSSPWPASTP